MTTPKPSKIAMPQSGKFLSETGDIRPEWVHFLTALVRAIASLEERVGALEKKLP